MNIMKNKSWLYIVGFILLALVGWGVWGLTQSDTDMPPTDFDEIGVLAIDNPGFTPNVWHLVYEAPGAPALTAQLNFTPVSECFRGSDEMDCEFEAGERARVWGNASGNVVNVVRLMVLDENGSAPMRTVQLYYYNQAKDRELGGDMGVACSADAVLPVEREVPHTITPIQDSVRELLRGDLSIVEKSMGFSTEFDESKLELVGANLEGGILTLEFRELTPGFTSGGSCRVTILWAQIEKTAKQFPGVASVRFIPEELFQP